VPAGELERFVIEQIKSIGRDTDLLAETLEESRRQQEESIVKLKTERRTLERELHRHNAELRELATQGRSYGVTTDRMADIQDRVRTAERRATGVREQIVALSRELVDAREVSQACLLFDPLWETLTAAEHARILHLLVEQVNYDGPNGMVSITFHPTGIKTLADELNQQEVTA